MIIDFLIYLLTGLDFMHLSDAVIGFAFSPFLISIDSISNRQIKVTALPDVVIKPLPTTSILLTEFEPSALPKFNGFTSIHPVYSTIDLALLSQPLEGLILLHVSLLPLVYQLNRSLLTNQPLFSSISPASLRSTVLSSSGLITSYSINRFSAGVLSNDAINLV